MIPTQMPQLKKVLGWVTLVSGLMVTPQTFANNVSGMNGEDNGVAGNVLKISGWYERYSSGQIVLYPVFKISSMSCMNGMSDMSDISGRPSMGGGDGMDGMPPSMGGTYGMHGMGTENIKQKPPQMTYGRFWIDKDGNLVLCPSNSKPGTPGTDSMSDMMGDNE
ncbi:MAG: hypothetical protein DRR19_02660 [Candidatus Parabeggiatoa sp. nov. 1]|nr:MAG: hypothetical protein DRR19_02660 [Gammaproteobacteria bacterium]